MVGARIEIQCSDPKYCPHVPWKRKMIWREKSSTDLEANIKEFIMNMMSLKQENINIKAISSFSKIFMIYIIYKTYLEETLMWVDLISQKEQKF